MHGLGFPEPAFLESFPVDDLHEPGIFLGVFVEDYACPIGGIVVVDDDFAVIVVLGDEGIEAGPYSGFLVARGNEDADEVAAFFAADEAGVEEPGFVEDGDDEHIDGRDRGDRGIGGDDGFEAHRAAFSSSPLAYSLRG